MLNFSEHTFTRTFDTNTLKVSHGYLGALFALNESLFQKRVWFQALLLWHLIIFWTECKKSRVKYFQMYSKKWLILARLFEETVHFMVNLIVQHHFCIHKMIIIHQKCFPVNLAKLLKLIYYLLLTSELELLKLILGF